MSTRCKPQMAIPTKELNGIDERDNVMLNESDANVFLLGIQEMGNTHQRKFN